MQTKTFTVIWSIELEKLIQEHLGVQTQTSATGWEPGLDLFSVVAEMEWTNDTMHEIDLDWIEKVNAEGDGSRTVRYIGQLMEKGVIPKEYPILIDVWW